MIPKVFVMLWLCGNALCQNIIGGSCVENYTNSIGNCVPAEHCQSALRAYENNGVRPTFCMHTFADPLVCCKDSGTYVSSSITTGSPVAAAAIPPVQVNSDSRSSSSDPPVTGKRISERKCEEYSRLGVPPPPASTPNKLIIGGMDTALNEVPHMAAVGWLNNEDTYSFNCGGSLISPSFVLTAGHCTSDPRARERAPALVRLGDQNIDPDADDGAHPEEIPIKSIIRHPSYDPPRRYDDIALLELATPAALSAAIHPACLWTTEEIDHETAVAVGWGVSNVKTKQHSKELQKVTLTIQDTAYCERLLAANRNRNWEGFARTQLCAGELTPGKDTCQGDSGAPLQVKTGSIYRIVGITSFGLNNCAESGRPAVYTRVSSYVPWIESVVWPEE